MVKAGVVIVLEFLTKLSGSGNSKFLNGILSSFTFFDVLGDC